MQHLLRRKIIYIVVGLILKSTVVSAQLVELNQPDHDDKLYHFGINVGLNRSHFNFTIHPNYFNQDSINVTESVNSMGLNLAWLVHLNLSDHLAIRTYPLNLTFSEKAFEYSLKTPDVLSEEKSIMTKKVQSITLSFPIQLEFSSDRIDNFKVYTVTGIRYDYDLAATAGSKNGDELIKLKKNNFLIEGGLGFHIYFPYFVLSPELRFSWGLSNLHSRNSNLKYSSVVDKINSRMITFGLTIE